MSAKPSANRFVLHANDRNRARVLANALDAISKLPEAKSWEVLIEPHKKDRTSQQNRALFGLAYPVLAEFMGLRTTPEKEALHMHFCGEFFGWRDVLGTRYPIRTTTTDENGKRDVIAWDVFAEFYDLIYQHAADAGCVIPDPDPMWRQHVTV